MLLGIALAPALSQRWQNQLGSPQAECLRPKDRVSDLALSVLSGLSASRRVGPLSLAKHPQPPTLSLKLTRAGLVTIQLGESVILPDLLSVDYS